MTRLRIARGTAVPMGSRMSTVSIAVAMLLGTATAAAQDAAAPQGQASAADSLEEIIVTGYRQSLNAALNTKRASIVAVDQIVADDIAAFPELNLAESVQRIPGISIQRDAGEGRQISVRGLGPQFTRVRINGMEALATIGTSDANGGTNRDRAFDFNVFASELFNSITVRKTASADVEEGALGATVDLRVARPFDYNGFTFVTGGKLGYNDLGDDFNPRGTVLISDTFGDGKFGALFSAAYSHRKLLDNGSSTVRWQQGGTAASNFNATLGSNYAGSGSTATLAEINNAFRPRIPRYDVYGDDQKRLGLTGSLQFAPTDGTLLTLDNLYAKFDSQRTETYLESPIFSSNGANGINKVRVQAAEVDEHNSLVYGVFDNVDIRTEDRFDDMTTKFRQHTLTLEQRLTDTLSLNAIAGYAKSEFENPIQTTLIWDANNVQGYTYDYRANSRLPVLGYGNANVTDPNAWHLVQIRQRPNGADNTFTNFGADLAWNATDALKLTGGAQFKKYEFSTTSFRLPSETAVSAQATVPTSSYSQLVKLTGVGAPAGTATVWATPDLDAAAGLMNLYDRSLFPLSINADLGNNRSVEEKDTGGFVAAQLSTSLFGIPVKGDLGVRYVRTQQSSTGWQQLSGGAQLITVDHSYNDTLPSLNIVANLTDTFLMRFGAAKVMARTGLGNLNPGGAVSISGQLKTVTAGNPLLDPTRATAIDLAGEWYFAKESLLSVALFYKDITSFVQTVRSTNQPFSNNPIGLPDSVATAACAAQGADPATCLVGWDFNIPANTPGGDLKGFEVSYQQPFAFLPAPFNNFGTILNYTYVDSKVAYRDSTGAIVRQATLTGLSKNGANATVYYDNGKWSARVSAAYRGDYLTTVPGRNGNAEEGTKSTLNLDFAAAWNVTDAFQLSLEGLNLTNEAQDQYVDTAADRLSYYHLQGREYLLGARYKF
ncbi:MAG TPA: TonB-dependent receptor [Steroidobacteraceae bacterium]|nr:TonB-dependent receptor [Steroidobacteraceae bacterium]